MTRVTEGSHYGDVEVKQETPDNYTVKSDMFPSGDDIDSKTCEMISPGSQSGANSETIKYGMLPSGSTSAAESGMVKCELLPCGSESGAVIQSQKCELLPPGSESGAGDMEPQCHTVTLTGNKASKGGWI